MDEENRKQAMEKDKSNYKTIQVMFLKYYDNFFVDNLGGKSLNLDLGLNCSSNSC